jgi:Trk K+ transport system NAD-binding subunit
MKFLASQFAYLISESETRANLRALVKYLLLLVALVSAFTIPFHVIKDRVEGQLPFLFIRLFYAPWLEARVRLRAPRGVPEGTTGHVILTEYDPIAIGLIQRLRAESIPYFVIEHDPALAARLFGDGVSVVTGDNDSRVTYEQLAAASARMLLANAEDTTNTNITLTAREIAPELPIVAIVEQDDSVDILELSGATTVLPLKHQLGEHLANRVLAAHAEAHVIGTFRDLQIAELPARDSPFVGQSVRDTHLRERTGLSVVGFWEHGRLRPAFPQAQIQSNAVIVVAGTGEQIQALNALLPAGRNMSRLVLVVGSGKVGQAATRALKRMDLVVHAIDRTTEILDPLSEDADTMFAGDAADRRLLERAGIDHASSVVLTTNDDAMNIYLTVFYRRLNPSLRIVSRVTHERNLEAIHRAGADFVLSYTTLGVEAVMSLLEGHPPVLLGEGVELFSIEVPDALAGRLLRDSEIGSRTGMSVVALEHEGRLITELVADTVLPKGGELLMLGSLEQRRSFAAEFDEQH